MTEQLWLAIIAFATKFGLNAAMVILGAMNKPAATIDDAIKSFAEAEQKSAEDFRREARERLGIPQPPTG